MIIVIIISIFCALVFSIFIFINIYELKHLCADEWNVKVVLLKKKERKSEIIYLFKNFNTRKEYIIRLKKGYLNKDYIPNEFLIEDSPKKEYYEYLKEILQENRTYIIMFGVINDNNQKKYLLSAKQTTNFNSNNK